MLRWARAEPTWTIVPASRRSISAEGRHGAPHRAQICDFRSPAELFRPDVPEGAEDGGHRVVDPYVDGAEPFLGGRRGGLDGLGVRHVGRDDERAAARRPD